MTYQQWANGCYKSSPNGRFIAGLTTFSPNKTMGLGFTSGETTVWYNPKNWGSNFNQPYWKGMLLMETARIIFFWTPGVIGWRLWHFLVFHRQLAAKSEHKWRRSPPVIPPAVWSTPLCCWSTWSKPRFFIVHFSWNSWLTPQVSWWPPLFSIVQS